MSGGKIPRFSRPSGAVDTGDDNIVQKLLGDRLHEVDELDLIQTGSAVTEYLPGGKVLSAGLEYAGGSVQAERQRTVLDRADITRAKYSKAARKAVEQVDNKPMERVTHYGFVALLGVMGAVAGAAVLPVLLPLPLMGLAGALAGSAAMSYVAEKIYKGHCDKDELQCVELAATGYLKKDVDTEKAAATLLANLPARLQERYSDRLQEAVGSDKFSDALKSEKGRAFLRRMAKEAETDITLRASIRLPRDPSQPEMPVAEQYAGLVNKGVLDARDIVLHPDDIAKKVHSYYAQGAQHASSAKDSEPLVPSALPHRGGHAKGHILPA